MPVLGGQPSHCVLHKCVARFVRDSASFFVIRSVRQTAG